MRNHFGLRCSRAVALVLFTLALTILRPLAAGAEQLTVAAAADLTFAFKDVATQFEQQTGNKMRVSYGSSGNFFSQIQNGAPYDIFFSADVQYPTKLETAGLIVPGSIYEYAAGKIVIWMPASSKVDVNQGLAVLLDPRIHKFAIANPAHAPYGRAAVAAMQKEGIYDQVKSKIVMGEDISQTAQFVQSGNADAGIVALSLALAPAMKEHGRYAIIPQADYPPLLQAAAIIKSTQHKELAERFLAFLKEPQTVAKMEQFGFIVPKDVANSSSGTANPK